MIADAVRTAALSLGRIASSVSIAVTGFVVVCVPSVFLAIDPQLYVAGLMRLVAPPRRARVREVLEAVASARRWWLVGRFSAMAAVPVLTFGGLFALGVPLAVVLAVIAGVLTFVPYLGPLLAAVLIGFAESSELALWVAGLALTVQLLENNLLTPLVQQRAVSLPPAVLIVAQLLLGALFGLLGLLLATPVAVAAIVLCQAFYVQDVLGDSVRLLRADHWRSGGGGARDPSRRAARSGS